MARNPTTLEVCVCTYRRPQLAETLHSLAQLNRPEGFDVSILVIDNDALPSAEALVRKRAVTSPVPLRYVHVPKDNISLARNGALSHSAADLLAFIDDDEVASPDWLIHLTKALWLLNADAVIGPVQAVYAPDAPAWMQAQSIHSTGPVWTKEGLKTGYTCNVLINRNSPHVRGLSFDLALGQSGGEDTAFFSEVHARGGHIAFAADALVFEDVPASRARFGWLIRRRFRMGQTHGKLLRDAQGRRAVPREFLLASAKGFACLGHVVPAVFDPARRNSRILRAVLHLGTLAGLLTIKPLKIYQAHTSKTAQSPAEAMDLK